MEIGKTLYFTKRQDWRKWLQKHFDKEKEIWLIYPKKNSDKLRIPYNDAVEEALCFGWIDSTAKSIDEFKFAQRFTPRNPKSTYSQPNKERLKWLAENKMLHPDIEAAVQHILNEKFNFPVDILAEIKRDKSVWKYYQSFSEGYRRLRVAYINDARERPEEFKKRLSNFMDKTRENKMIKGFGGIEKYY